jgi:hypothetical protein
LNLSKQKADNKAKKPDSDEELEPDLINAPKDAVHDVKFKTSKAKDEAKSKKPDSDTELDTGI